MFEEERKQKIIRLVQSKSRTSIQELCRLLQVSESTIRRDLTDLENKKLLKRTHGGAIDLRSVNFEPSYYEKEDQFTGEKEAMAKKAAELIEDGDSLLIDSGTSTSCLALELSKFSNLTVVTNSIPLMQKLSGMEGIEIIATGGTLRKNTMAFTGPLSDSILDNLRVDKAFLGTNGLDIKSGLTTPNVVEAATKRKMISAANQTYIMADHSKIGRVSFAKFAALEQIDGCITSDIITPEQKQDLESHNIKLYIAATGIQGR